MAGCAGGTAMSGTWIAVIVALWAVVVILAVIQIGILRRVLPFLEQAAAVPAMPPAPPAGMVLPHFEATLDDGSAITAAQLAGRPFVLFFASRGCAPCRRLLLQLDGRSWPPGQVAVYLVMADDARAEIPVPAGLTPLLEHDGSVSRTLGVTATPLAVAVDGQGVVIESLVPRDPGDLDRLRRALEPDHSRTGLRQPVHEPTALIRHYHHGRVNDET
jgi:hypothetical protein